MSKFALTTIENTIGRIRRYLPKGKPLDDVSNEAVTAVEERLNHTLRKCLGYKTPADAMNKDLMYVPVR
jgi:transposase, IS30 family